MGTARLTYFMFSVGCLLCLGLQAQNENKAFQHEVETAKKPWTNKPFYNNPDHFQFAIVSDRTGGHRKGVFGNGLKKINQLYPEFVMSVGDLIEGYSKDTTVLNAEWKEFNGILDTLETKFFYVAGNHDYSNTTMAAQWKERYGKDYYHFTYKNVLFLIVNTNDGDGVLMGKDQIAYLKQAIARYTEVRWTMIFMHHPMWTYGEVNGFNEVEEALKGRDYTVFAGHTHRYLYEVRNDQNHYVLGTTGGGSQLRGPKFGEFDHVGWVTMTEKGPKLANLALSGVLAHDVSTKTSAGEAINLIKATDFKPLVLSKGDERKVILKLHNDADKALYFKGQLYHHHQILPDSSKFNIVLPPKSSHAITIYTKPDGNYDKNTWDPLELEWSMGYDPGFMQPEFSLSGTERIELSPTAAPPLAITEQSIFTDQLTLAVENPYQNENITLKFSTNGSEPDGAAKTLADSLMLTETVDLKMALFDAQGFKSASLSKEIKKVEPLKPVNLKKPKKGARYTYFEGEFTSVPDFKRLGSPLRQGIAEDLSPDKIGQRLDHYAIQYKGYLQIPKTGIYTFYLASDDGSKLFLHDQLVVDNDGSHDAKSKIGFMALKKGWHPVRIDYFEDFLGEKLELEYASDHMQKSTVPLWHE
jgi:predicted phosphodiesterase